MNIEQFDYSTDLGQVVLWQYDQSTNLTTLINDKQAWLNVNQTQFWQDWFANVFNLADPLTINEFGLGVWSVILLAPLFSAAQNPDNTEIWGFNQDPAINTYVNYNNGEFYYDRLISLSEPEQQFLLLLRYFDCVTRGALTDSSLLTFSPSSGQHWSNSAPIEYINNYPIGINYYFLYLLSDLLGGPNLGPLIGFTGSIYCLDNLNMSVTYQFTTGDFPPNLMEAITLLDLWPRPAGVAISFQTL